MNELLYPFDPTGSNPLNLITDELHALSPVTWKDYFTVVPLAAPYFGDSLEIINEDTSAPLVEGVDYIKTHKFISASNALNKDLYGTFSFFNKSYAGNLRIRYQTIGGDWVINSEKITEQLANILSNPRETIWEQITNLPFQFPILDHEQPIDDLVGLSGVKNEIDTVEQTLSDHFANASSIAAHVSNVSNPHDDTKDEVGLSNLEDYPPATLEQAQDPNYDQAYMTPRRTRQSIEKFAYEHTDLTITDYYTKEEFLTLLQGSIDGNPYLPIAQINMGSLPVASTILPGYTVGVYYGGDSDIGYSTQVTRIDANGALVGTETDLGSFVYYHAAAHIGGNAVFYGGNNGLLLDIALRVDINGLQVGLETNVGTAREGLAGATVDIYGIFYGGNDSSITNILTKLDSNAEMVGSEVTLSTPSYGLAAASIGNYGVFYGGYYYDGVTSDYSNKVSRIDVNNALVGSETSIGTARNGLAGASVGDCGVYYGGYNAGLKYNTVTRINALGTQEGLEVSIGGVRAAPASASIGDYGVYYGGYDNTYINTVTRIDANGIQVGSENSIGVAKNAFAGAGV